MSRILGLITARGGSKGIPNKNIKRFAGESLIYWTIKAAKESLVLDDVIVSTDSETIAGIALRCGAKVPKLRNPEFAKDDSPHIDCVIEALSWVEGFKYCCLLQPTSPLRTAFDIDSACTTALWCRNDSLVSVTENFDYKFVARKSLLGNFIKTPVSSKYTPRQKITPRYFINGAIYVNTVEHLIRKKSFYDKKMGFYVMKPENAMQIDDQLDFGIAEYLMLRRIDDNKTETKAKFSTSWGDINL